MRAYLGKVSFSRFVALRSRKMEMERQANTFFLFRISPAQNDKRCTRSYMYEDILAP